MCEKSNEMQVSVLLFATLKDRAGQARLTLALPGDMTTVADVRKALAAQVPGLESHLGSAIAAVNEEYAFPVDKVREGDVVAFFPPVSGGDDFPMIKPEIFRLAGATLQHR